jgi:hypothetical protein
MRNQSVGGAEDVRQAQAGKERKIIIKRGERKIGHVVAAHH